LIITSFRKSWVFGELVYLILSVIVPALEGCFLIKFIMDKLLLHVAKRL